MLLYLCQQMIGYTDTLTQADLAIGDGDHGIGMARGFEAVYQKLEAGSFAALDDLFKTIGMTLIISIGGASGIIFGTWFRGGAKSLASHHRPGFAGIVGLAGRRAGGSQGARQDQTRRQNDGGCAGTSALSNRVRLPPPH